LGHVKLAAPAAGSTRTIIAGWRPWPAWPSPAYARTGRDTKAFVSCYDGFRTFVASDRGVGNMPESLCADTSWSGRAGTTRPTIWAILLRCTVLEVHLGHQVIGELVVYLNAATLCVRHQQAAVRRVERHRSGLGEGPLRFCTTHLTTTLE